MIVCSEPFEGFPKIARLNRACTITEKIDGTNAQVYIDEEGQIFAGSRTRWITPEQDNYGFAKFVADHEDELKLLGPGHHFGEWWGSGIQRRYDQTEKHFSLFNTARWTDNPERPWAVSVVPVLYQGQFSTGIVDETLAELAKTGSVAAPGFMDPEGIVVFMHASRTMYKVTIKGDEMSKAEMAAREKVSA